MHITDVSNASRTLLYNINTMEWDDELLNLFDIPKSMLPEVKSSSEIYGTTSTTLFSTKIPISGIAGDQQAALFGQMCVEEGMAKNTYGTGCFLLMNIGEKPVFSKNNLLTTVAWQIDGKTTYALEGSVFVGGAVIQWLRDGLKIISSAPESERLSASVEDNGGVYFVPALTGLGAPYWDQYARGAIFGITRGTTQANIAKAAIQGIAFQVDDLIKSMKSDVEGGIKELRVDGGACANNVLMQFQADLIENEVIRPKVLETTSLGAAYLAGLAVGYWKNIDEIKVQWKQDRVFKPEMNSDKRADLLKFWNKAVKRTQNWIED